MFSTNCFNCIQLESENWYFYCFLRSQADSPRRRYRPIILRFLLPLSWCRLIAQQQECDCKTRRRAGSRVFWMSCVLQTFTNTRGLFADITLRRRGATAQDHAPEVQSGEIRHVWAFHILSLNIMSLTDHLLILFRRGILVSNFDWNFGWPSFRGGYGREAANNPGNNLYVTGLSTRVTEKDLEDHFSTEGKVWFPSLLCFGVVLVLAFRISVFALQCFNARSLGYFTDECLRFLCTVLLRGTCTSLL